jgi:ectoine hydroxylase-related dioxygenase (phytanoyl-CoA dioxygenase family)
MERDSALTLSNEQIAAYERDGYLVVGDVLTPAEVSEFVSYESEEKPEGWRQSLVHHKDDARWSYLACHPNVAGIARQLLDGLPMIVQTMYLEKAPAGDREVGGSGVALHQDLHYLPCEPDTLMACWIAMSDTDEVSGGLCVVPGSHHDGLFATHKTENVQDHDAWEIEYLMRDRRGKTWTTKMYSFEIDGLDMDQLVRLKVPEGSAVFFTGKTIHGSFGNRSKDRFRRAFAVHFVREGTWCLRADVQDTMAAVATPVSSRALD